MVVVAAVKLLWSGMPSPDRTRLWVLLAGVIAAAILVAWLGWPRDARGPAPTPPAPPQPRPLDIAPPPLPIPPPPLAHAELVAAASRAAAAQALSEDAPAADRELVGRRFLVRLPFGCGGARQDDLAAWTYDSRRQALTLQAQPQNWTGAGWVRQLAGAAGVDAIEGFWLPRPVTEECAPAAAESAETVGLAMFFEPNSSRVLRRGDRPYDFTGKAAPPSDDGYRLILAGRIAGFDGEAARCRKDAPPDQPVCLIAVEFDQVAFEDPVTGQMLAEWRIN